jgi:hypothetical protein
MWEGDNQIILTEFLSVFCKVSVLNHAQAGPGCLVLGYEAREAELISPDLPSSSHRNVTIRVHM